MIGFKLVETTTLHLSGVEVSKAAANQTCGEPNLQVAGCGQGRAPRLIKTESCAVGDQKWPSMMQRFINIQSESKIN